MTYVEICFNNNDIILYKSWLQNKFYIRSIIVELKIGIVINVKNKCEFIELNENIIVFSY